MLFLTPFLAAAGTNRYTCATCHSKEAADQPDTAMAHALLLPDQNPLFRAHNDLHFQFGKFTYSVATTGGKTTYSVTDGAAKVTLPIQWSFGEGAQTFVLEREGQFFESLVSYYPATGALDVTLGDQSLNPQTVDEAVGRKLAERETTECFGCHSTRSGSNGKLNLQSLIPGITCEKCHVQAPAHLASISQRGSQPGAHPIVPEQLGKKSAESVSNFCGQCHRSWQTVVRNNWRGEMNVRFQPYRLANSRCFDGADARISCLACHNPHEHLVKDKAWYDRKCLACHASQIMKTAAASGSLEHAKACPVSNSGCVTCHMPVVQLPGGHQTFTDHQIRVVKPGESYPN